MLVLTLAIGILSYEFVYKEQRERTATEGTSSPMRAVLFSCVIPYMVGSMALMALAAISF